MHLTTNGQTCAPRRRAPAKLYSRAPRERTVSLPPRDYLLAGRLLLAATERDVNDSTREALAEAAR